ncbi:MAG: TlpA family protein disulfide reductase [Crocinitomicaceae bacterium]|nr:TlpA family protein disulfide reductase [Crocinitomicaceae bacterium]
MKSIILLIVLTISYTVVSQKQVKIKKGAWISELQLNETDVLPFHIKVTQNNQITILNGEEEIALNSSIYKNDSFYVKFPYFNSELVFHQDNKKTLNGYWVNYNKSANYRIPFTSIKKKSTRFGISKKIKNSIVVDGKWQVEFEPNSDSSYPAVGIFEQKKINVSGTFLTETGDYRFLEGNSTTDSLLLSCFDGSHAFLFKARLNNDTLKGTFFSGNHWQSDWYGVRNDNYTLISPDDLTYIVKEDALKFQLKDLNNNDFNFPHERFNNKVVIIQIMGTWCPNCLDETHYYKELYDKYNTEGLEIISICYEAGKSFEEYVANVERLKSKLDINFTFLIGGKASKNLASEHFKVLNEVISFPTSIFIGRDGKVKRVHTGFNGPGTGSYYNEYIEKTEALIQTLLDN